MKPPENDLFEVTIRHQGASHRILVQVTDQKSTVMVVRFFNQAPGRESAVEGEFGFIGSDFPGVFQPTCLGNLRKWVGDQDADKLREILEAGGIYLGTLTIARALKALGDDPSISAHEALKRAQTIDSLCEQWLKAVQESANQARMVAAATQPI